MDTYVIELERNETLQFDVTLNNPDDTPVNLTGYKARLHIRPWANWESVVTPTMTFTTEDGKLVLDALAGKVTVKFSAADAQTLNSTNVRKVKYALGLEAYNDLVSPIVVQKMIRRGQLIVSASVVR